MNIAVEMLNAAAGVKITHVPYRGAAPAINDLLGGHVDMLNADLPVLAAAGQSRLGQGDRAVRRGALAAVAGSADDQGTRPAERGDGKLVRRACCPPARRTQMRDKLEQALLAVVAAPAVKQRFAEIGMHGTLGHEAFETRLKKNWPQWPETIKTARDYRGVTRRYRALLNNSAPARPQRSFPRAAFRRRHCAVPAPARRPPERAE